MPGPPPVYVTCSAPLFPPGTGDSRAEAQTVRDRQVWPRHVRHTDRQQELRRTAAIKHHLRKPPRQSEMLTTYEHDFSFMTRPPHQGGPEDHLGVTGRTARWPLAQSGLLAGYHPAVADRLFAEKGMQASRSMSELQANGWKVGRSASSGALGATTESKLQSLSSTGRPMKLSIRGWSDSAWTPKTHPSMINGFSDSRNTLVQTANVMNLRAPDLPFCTR